MVYVVTKNIKGKEYLYLVESTRTGTRVQQRTIKYLGRKRPLSKEEFSCITYSHSGKDWFLGRAKDELSYQDHERLRTASQQQTIHLKTLDETSQHKIKQAFLSKFIAESNAIEGSTLTREETHHYLFEDIIPRQASKKELYMAENLLEAWNYLERNVHRAITEQDIKTLHFLVNQRIETKETLGRYKRVQNYIGDVITTSHYWVNERMKQFQRFTTKNNLDTYEAAFQGHAQFETIHPFIDGNGRLGRLIINWVLMNNNLQPLALLAKNRSAYLAALNNSRKGQLRAISKFCYEEYLEQYTFIT